MSDVRAQALRELIAYRPPIEPTLATLASFGWDSPAPLVSLTAGAMVKTIERFLSGELSAEQLIDWANLIECREDIAMAEEPPGIATVIFRLANPNLEGPVTPALAAEIRDFLLGASDAAAPQAP